MSAEETKPVRLRRTVEELGRILESYQVDLRERGLDREGFCQGVIYREDAPRLVSEALQLIEWIESEERP